MISSISLGPFVGRNSSKSFSDEKRNKSQAYDTTVEPITQNFEQQF
jgi:hypothetical protein